LEFPSRQSSQAYCASRCAAPCTSPARYPSLRRPTPSRRSVTPGLIAHPGRQTCRRIQRATACKGLLGHFRGLLRPFVLVSQSWAVALCPRTRACEHFSSMQVVLARCRQPSSVLVRPSSDPRISWANPHARVPRAMRKDAATQEHACAKSSFSCVFFAATCTVGPALRPSLRAPGVTSLSMAKKKGGGGGGATADAAAPAAKADDAEKDTAAV
jgi:hypothetical protein